MDRKTYSLTIKRAVKDIEGLEEFEDYYVDVLGNIWSFKSSKPKILKTSWMTAPHLYRGVCLVTKNKKHKSFAVHRLVALAFLTPENKRCYVKHINGNLHDNRVENLVWVPCGGRKRSPRKEKLGGISIETAQEIKRVAMAANMKGLPGCNPEEFIEKLIHKSLKEFVTEYGLRKLMQ